MSMEPGTTVSAEVERLLPNPQPVTGCDICAALYTQRLKYMNKSSPEYNPARAAEASHEIRSHPHGA
ncbi:hypothetical protein [Streptomyces sp. NRRL S-378]|uniref:hypothetical protein n=1 Tax=Streptomyces sp. NRRL S-378 TaxID=1463904 RepID=UPI00068A3604|nr:hypothetical protein [Streptomyces sp. NRRL S-378]